MPVSKQFCRVEDLPPRPSPVTREWLVLLGETYVGTRFLDQGRDRAGLDCVGFAQVISSGSGLSDFDFRTYRTVADPRHDQPTMLEMLDVAMGGRVPPYEALPGDWLVFRDLLTKEPQHAGMLHSVASARERYVMHVTQKNGVTLNRIDHSMARLVVAAFRPPGRVI